MRIKRWWKYHKHHCVMQYLKGSRQKNLIIYYHEEDCLLLLYNQQLFILPFKGHDRATTVKSWPTDASIGTTYIMTSFKSSNSLKGEFRIAFNDKAHTIYTNKKTVSSSVRVSLKFILYGPKIVSVSAVLIHLPQYVKILYFVTA